MDSMVNMVAAIWFGPSEKRGSFVSERNKNRGKSGAALQEKGTWITYV